MGVWDVGVFENDRAADFLVDFLRTQISRIESLFIPENLDKASFLERYGIPQILPLMEIVSTLCDEHGETPLLEKEQVEEWQKIYLDVFDKDDSIWAKNVKAKRREVIVETFERFKKSVVDADDLA